jgi:hypothetical protein
LPHEPQLFASKVVKVQAPLQLVCPGKQFAWQLPKLQTWVPVQAWPQVPQLAGSVCVRTQAVPHLVKPAAQAQALFTQEELAPQAMPQPPQFAASETGLTHWVPQVR